MKQHQTVTVGKTILLFSIALATLIITAACASIDARAKRSTGQIFLYGEIHGVPRIMNRKLEIWGEYYHNRNMRHLFIELPYFSAEFLNVWMQSGNDDMLFKIFGDWTDDWTDNPPDSPAIMFFRTIKNEFPETIFHGVDVGHQYWSTGRLFLQYLRDNNLQGTERYLRTLEAIEQGERYYSDFDHEFRVTTMTENFIRAFDGLGGQNVMGVLFGVTHIAFGYMTTMGFPDTPTMAQRLRERYGDALHTTDLSLAPSEGLPLFALEADPMPIRTDIITINDTDYEASYFGTHLTFATQYFVSLSFWRLENAYDDFSGKPATGDMLLAEHFPMVIEVNQVFIVAVTLADGSVARLFYRSDGMRDWNGNPVTTGFIAD